jgi:NAD(P)H dehydrogenase (quinone)
MNVLIVLAHPNPHSFTAGLVREARAFLTDAGHQVTVRDLYRPVFDPLLGPRDFLAYEQGSVPEDVKNEQKLLADADLLILAYPLWWAGMPAILKGWLDRIMTQGFSFRFDASGHQKLLTGKKCWAMVCMGNDAASLEDSGLVEAMHQCHGEAPFGWCGIDYLGTKYFDRVPEASDAVRQGYISDMQAALADLLEKHS